MISRQTSLTRNLVQFCRWLRMQRFPVAVEEELLALRAISFTNMGSSKIFFEVLRAILCRTKSQLEVFEHLYDEYWKNLLVAVDSKITNSKTKSGQKKKSNGFESLKTWLYGINENNLKDSPAYSPSGKYSQKDFSRLSGDEIEEMQLAIKAMAKKMSAKLERRTVPSPDIYLPDLRRTLRKNLRTGGELMHIVHKRPKRSRSKLIVICDTSRSMVLYTAFLIRFMYAMQKVYK